jgi:hypothetical protein
MMSKELRGLVNDESTLHLLFREAIKAYEFFLPTRPIPALMAELLVADALLAVDVFVIQKELLAEDLTDHVTGALWAIAEAQGVGAISCFMENVGLRKFYRMQEHGRSMVPREFIRRAIVDGSDDRHAKHLIAYWHHTPMPKPDDVASRAEAAGVDVETYKAVAGKLRDSLARCIGWSVWGHE